MPCSDGRDRDDYDAVMRALDKAYPERVKNREARWWENRRREALERDKLKQAFDKIDQLSSLLCAACQYLVGADVSLDLADVHEDLSDWWQDHEKYDRSQGR